MMGAARSPWADEATCALASSFELAAAHPNLEGLASCVARAVADQWSWHRLEETAKALPAPGSDGLNPSGAAS